MTAPDVNADVRARFEAWASNDGKVPKAVERTCYDDGYRLMATHLFWLAWQAAHADLAGEVRELVDRALDAAAFLNGIGRHDRAQPLRKAAHAIRSPKEDALAKFHPTQQEKP